MRLNEPRKRTVRAHKVRSAFSIVALLLAREATRWLTILARALTSDQTSQQENQGEFHLSAALRKEEKGKEPASLENGCSGGSFSRFLSITTRQAKIKRVCGGKRALTARTEGENMRKQPARTSFELCVRKLQSTNADTRCSNRFDANRIGMDGIQNESFPRPYTRT